MRDRVRKWLPRIALALAGAALLLLFAAAVTPQGRAMAKTAGLVAQVLPNAPIQPLGWFTREPERERITYSGPDGPAEADIYRLPGDKQRPALLFFLGVNPAGRDDERIVNLATALARTGYVVMVPWSENMVGGRVDYGDVELLVAAFEHLKGLDIVDPERIGSGGFCVGSSLLTVAAADPRIRDDVRFVNFFSGYFDGRDFLAQFGARQAYYQESTRTWDVDVLTWEVFRRILIEGLAERDETVALAGHFSIPMTEEQIDALSPEARSVFDRLSQEVPPEEARMEIERVDDPGERIALAGHFLSGAMTPNETEALTPPALAVYRLLSGVETVEEAHLLLEQLPPDLLANMDRLSPIHYVEDVRADLWIMHDKDDELAPFEESLRLYDAVRDRPNVTFTAFEFFQHVDPAVETGLFDLMGESWKLLRHLYRVMRFAS